MSQNPIVSVIVPTYNRANVISETLDSILAQSFNNWECIVVDDGSTDATDDILEMYQLKDSRFRYYHRPNSHLAGGNGARNFGFKQSKGIYIQWFDSDDLMVPEKLELQVAIMQNHDVDFVVSKTKFFNKKNNSFFNYNFEASEVNFESYAIDYIRWITGDLLVKRSIAKKISFNENLTAGQEHNFNCKLLLVTNNLYYLSEFFTLRRYSENSIQGQRDQSLEMHNLKMFETHWFNYKDLAAIANSPKFNRYSMLQCVQCYLRSHNSINLPLGFKNELRKVFPRRYIYFYFAEIASKLFGKYYKFYEWLKNGEIFNTYNQRKIQ
ncbi:MAG: glycosyltransferase family 2 protein [Psychroserpens sp.]|uniref:glycosyltransferase family 2 protein n=1 Tax=Psychroserpens sp. TaxID=2020870 RepID=UPI003C9862C1